MQTIPIGCDVSKDKIDLCVWLNDGKQEYLLIGNNQKDSLLRVNISLRFFTAQQSCPSLTNNVGSLVFSTSYSLLIPA